MKAHLYSFVKFISHYLSFISFPYLTELDSGCPYLTPCTILYNMYTIQGLRTHNPYTYKYKLQQNLHIRGLTIQSTFCRTRPVYIYLSVCGY